MASLTARSNSINQSNQVLRNRTAAPKQNPYAYQTKIRKNDNGKRNLTKRKKLAKKGKNVDKQKISENNQEISKEIKEKVARTKEERFRVTTSLQKVRSKNVSEA